MGSMGEDFEMQRGDRNFRVEILSPLLNEVRGQGLSGLAGRTWLVASWFERRFCPSKYRMRPTAAKSVTVKMIRRGVMSSFMAVGWCATLANSTSKQGRYGCCDLKLMRNFCTKNYTKISHRLPELQRTKIYGRHNTTPYFYFKRVGI